MLTYSIYNSIVLIIYYIDIQKSTKPTSMRGCKLQITDPNEESRSMLRIAFEIRECWPSRNSHNWRVIDWKFNRALKNEILNAYSRATETLQMVQWSGNNWNMHFLHNNHVPIINSMHQPNYLWSWLSCMIIICDNVRSTNFQLYVLRTRLIFTNPIKWRLSGLFHMY